jgi:hypothetical protein
LRGGVLIALMVAGCGRDKEVAATRVPEESQLSPPPSSAVARSATLVIDHLAAPESVVHDTEADVYLVSNVNGDPGELDDNGFIARVSPDGQVLDPRWIDGARPEITLNAPRGLALDSDTLYVVDVDALRLFDRNTGAPKATWPIPDPHFPNDITIDGDGKVVITETGIHIRPDGEPIPEGTQRIWRYDTPGGEPTAIAEGDALIGPNGIVWTGDGLVVVGLLGASLYRLENGAPHELAELPIGRLDGLALLPDGSFLATSWLGKAIYHVSRTGKISDVINGADILTPASIEYDRKRGRILIPLLKANQLRIETWPAPL